MSTFSSFVLNPTVYSDMRSHIFPLYFNVKFTCFLHKFAHIHVPLNRAKSDDKNVYIKNVFKIIKIFDRSKEGYSR